MLKLFSALITIVIAWPAAAQDIRLTGVMVSGPASLAIVTGPDGRDKVVRIGQEINPGATLGEVSAHGVVVLRNQRREWVPLVGGAAAAPSPVTVAPQQPKLTIPAAAPAVATQTSEAPETRRSKEVQGQHVGAGEALAR
jgi:hypothetical protein